MDPNNSINTDNFENLNFNALLHNDILLDNNMTQIITYLVKTLYV